MSDSRYCPPPRETVTKRDEVRAAATHKAETVKRVDLFGVIHDTYQTETELNGWKPTQGGLL